MPECDIAQTNNRDIAYDQPWLQYAIPSTDGKYEKCFRYAIKNHTSFETDQCNADMFDNSTKIECTEYIYGSDEKNIQTEVGQIIPFIQFIYASFHFLFNFIFL